MVAGVCHGLSQEWDEQGRHTRYEVLEMGICIWRRRWEAGQFAEGTRMTESDNDYSTLQMLREHFMRGLGKLGSRLA